MSDFIARIAPVAMELGTKGNVLPSLIIAQGVLESASGTSELAVGANNLFGIKKGTGWNGPVYAKNSAEWSEEKGWYSVVSEFRQYESIDQCIQDLVDKYNNMSRYSAVLGKTDPVIAAHAVFAAGYATDPTYPIKLINIIDQYNLRQYDTQEPIQGEDPIDLPPVEIDPELPIIEGVIEMVNPKDILVAIDGGHGPNTPGKETPYISSLGRKIQEEEFNFPVARLLKAELERQGFRTMTTHNESYDVPLTTRTNRANAAKANILVSIHFNAMGNTMGYSTASGFSAHIQEGSTSASNSYKLANLMVQELARGTKQVNRGVVRQNLAITRQTNMPAVLVECGFMDDPVEAMMMLNTDFQKEVASELAKAICRFYGVTYQNVSGGVIPVSNPNPVTSNKFYRVRTSWADLDSQKGAFLDLAGAKDLADNLKGHYEVYDWDGKMVYDPTPDVVKPAAPDIEWPTYPIGEKDRLGEVKIIKDTPYRRLPDNNSPIISNLKVGHECHYYEIRGDFYRLGTGWVYKGVLEVTEVYADEAAKKAAEEKAKAEELAKAKAEYAAQYKKAIELGITDGSRPLDPVTREQAAVMIIRALKL